MNDNKYIVSSTPHIRSNASIQEIMIDVILALTPAALAAIYFFGLRAAMVIILSVASCIFSEELFQKLTNRPSTVKDCSAIVTGLLLAMNLPASSPFWLPIVGGIFAIIIVKQLFGGLGQNFVNPALAARAFLQTSYAEQMINFTTPISNPLSMGLDAVSTATPLAALKAETFTPETGHYVQALIGNIGGSLGETCAIALLIGAAYLLFKKVISWRIPVAYLLTFGILAFVFGRNGLLTGLPIYEILVGGLLLGSFYMATDYSSSPMSADGQLIMGFGCGALTFLIRNYGGYPEGVCYSILLMNLFVPLIDRYVRPKVFGVSKAKGVHKNV